MSGLPSFEAFFESVHEFPPFPWQVRLASQVNEEGWPDLLDLPTAAGKTCALDVALYCLAARPDRLPRRTVLVVDRRIVVDQGASHARKLLKAMRSAVSGPSRTVADALRALWKASDGEDPFTVAVMRGGMPRDNDWAKRPDQPVLGVSTVDQLGSRLLFRGFGVSSNSASIHAGLLGNDTLILLDEVHLAVPLAQTLATIQRRYRHIVEGLPDRFGIVRMSATAGSLEPGWRVFALDDADRRHAVLSRRLTAAKQAQLVPVKVSGDDEPVKLAALADAGVREALRLQAEGSPIVGVVFNRVDTARLARRRLADAHRDATDVVLVTGRMRPIDRDRIVKDVLLPRAGARHLRPTADRPLVVVATQCIEAGADLDFDALVTECASLDALRQRFGRLDRQGLRQRSAAVILGRSDAIKSDHGDPVYGGALAACWEWLQGVATGGIVDFGIDALPTAIDATGAARLDLLAPIRNAPIMLPTHLDTWSQTSPMPAFDPDVSLWLHGPDTQPADVQIVWRADVDLPPGSADDSPSAAHAIDTLSVPRPSALESMTLPFAVARRWLAGQDPGAVADVVAAAEDDEDPRPRPRLRNDRRVVALRWDGDDTEYVAASQIRPGDVLVVPSDRGGITAGSFDPDSREPVTDLGDLAQFRARGTISLRLSPAALKAWSLQELLISRVPAVEADESAAETRDRVATWVEAWPELPPESCLATASEWERITHTIVDRRRVRVAEVADRLVVTARPPTARVSVEVTDVPTEDDSGSFRQVEILLDAHCAAVRRVAREFAESVGMSPSIVNDIALAAMLHDTGKADVRFQRWLAGGTDIDVANGRGPLAKAVAPTADATARRLARRRAGYPNGCRHELLSLAMAANIEDLTARAHDVDLVLHLVASHHGRCRPFAPMVEDPDDVVTELDHGGLHLSARTRHLAGRLDSGVGERFWRLTGKYGWWGLAWLEAILRLADHRASELETGGTA